MESPYQDSWKKNVSEDIRRSKLEKKYGWSPSNPGFSSTGGIHTQGNQGKLKKLKES